MSSVTSQRSSRDSPHLRRGLLPGWAASIWLHALLLVLAAVGLRSCTAPGQRGEADTDWRAVGLVTRMEASESREQVVSESTPTTETQLEQTNPTELPPIDDTALQVPPVPVSELPSLPSVIGPGSRVPSFSGTPSDHQLTTSGIASPVSPSGLARGETDFFGIRDRGESIVYLLDISGSMSSPPEAIIAAKSELIASLATLTSEQRFQVIFYNERPQVMRLPGMPPQKLYPATDINRTLARQEILSKQPALGTSHMPALKAALELDPDVVFFLTDAEDPALNSKQIDEIRRQNGGRARIHAVEFGKEARLKTSSAMEQLARVNNGKYAYRDVTRFAR